MSHDEIIAALMNGQDPWALAEEVGSDRVEDAIEALENWTD